MGRSLLLRATPGRYQLALVLGTSISGNVLLVLPAALRSRQRLRTVHEVVTRSIWKLNRVRADKMPRGLVERTATLPAGGHRCGRSPAAHRLTVMKAA